MRTLTAVMLRNPYLLVAAGVAELTRRIVSANRELARNRDLIREVLDMDATGTQAELDSNQAAIIALTREIEKLEAQHEAMGVTGTEAAEMQLAPLRRQMDLLVEQRKEIGLNVVARRRNVDVVDDETEAIESQSVAIERSADSMNLFKNELLDVRRIMADDMELDLDMDTRPAEGSIAHLQMVLAGVNEQIRQTNDETWRQAQIAQAESIEAQIEEMYRLQRETEQGYESISIAALMAEDVARTFTDSFGRGMANVVVQGEKLQDVLKNIGRLLVSSAIQTGLRMLLMGPAGLGGQAVGGLFGRVFGGMFAQGGTLGAGQWGIAGEAGPEVIHGPARITPMQSGGTQNIVVHVRGSLKGSDLALLQERVTRTQSRTGRR
jgi:hypothetical protein